MTFDRSDVLVLYSSEEKKRNIHSGKEIDAPGEVRQRLRIFCVRLRPYALFVGGGRHNFLGGLCRLREMAAVHALAGMNAAAVKRQRRFRGKRTVVGWSKEKERLSPDNLMTQTLRT